jgi:hypothetical protein
MTNLIESLRAKQKPEVFADKVDLVKLDDMEKQPSGFSPEPTNPHGGNAHRGMRMPSDDGKASDKAKSSDGKPQGHP